MRSDEYNPDNLIWNDLRNNSIDRKVIAKVEQLKKEAIFLRFFQKTPKRIRSCFCVPTTALLQCNVETIMRRLIHMSHQDKTLIFLHIPKAAGSTLAAVIERQFDRHTIYNVRGDEVRESINEFKNLSEDKRRQIKCLKGHMSFGLHNYLPLPATYITMLRDPVERVISHYSYVLRTPAHYLHKRVASAKMGLREYVRSGLSPELSNGQVRLISGIKSVDSISGNNPVSIDILNVAKRNLQDYFAVVGLSERFDESLILFKRILGWENVFYIKQNVAVTRFSSQEVYDEETIDVIRNVNRLDLKLYDYAVRMFESLVRDQDETFTREVARFQLLNAYYYPFSPHRMLFKIRKGKDYLLRRIPR